MARFRAANIPRLDDKLVVAGGVAANRALRARLDELAGDTASAFSRRPLRCAPTMPRWSPGPGLSGWRRASTDPLDFAPRPRWPLDGEAEAAPFAGVQGMSAAYKSAGVIGAGSWGTALAAVAARGGLATTLWSRSPAMAEAIARDGENRAYLPGVRLPDGIAVTSELQRVVEADLLLIATPAQAMRNVLSNCSDVAPRHARHHLRQGDRARQQQLHE